MLSSRWIRPTLLLALVGCNDPPEGLGVRITPEAPSTVDDLVASPSPAAVDPNDDPLTYSYAWTAEGVDEVITSEVLPADQTRKGQVWTVSVVASDGKLQSESASASTEVLNSAPTADLSLVQDRVPTTDDIEAAVLTNDLDQDEVDLNVIWRRNGAVMTGTGLTVPAAQTQKGDIWEITVIPSDDEVEGDSQTLAARVINSAPAVLGATVDPGAFDVRDELTCLSRGWSDADDDDEGYRVRWLVNGREVAVAGQTLLGTDFAKGDGVRCELTPWDGEDEGEPVLSDEVVADNAPPEVRSAHVDPAAPTTVDDLTVVLDEVYDADGDEVDLRYGWSVNGRLVSTSDGLSAERTTRGDRVTVTLTPTDGTDVGPDFVVGPITVANTAPVLRSVSISPTSARTNDTLTAITSATDADGDRITMSYDWRVDGTSTGVTTATLDGRTWFDKGDRVTVVATPSDGTDAGSSLTSAAVTIANTAPTAPGIRITPTSPTSSDSLRCTIATASTDADRDRISYSATWTRNGSTYSGASTTVFTGDTIGSSVTRNGETWACTVWASDGTALSSRITASTKVNDWSGRRTFTSCAQTGQNGPTSSGCSSAYSGTTLAGEVTVSSGKQQWTVPITGSYRIEAWGAQGASAQSGRTGGRGARMRGTFSLTKGQVLTILVGQSGTEDGCSGGGGGGSYVARGTSVLLAAGGGGGTRNVVSQNGCDGRTSTSAGTGSASGSTWSCGAKASSTIGYGGIVSGTSWGSGGGAWSRDGAYEYTSDNRGRSFTNGGKGGGNTTYDAYGGFGGGGSGNGGCGGGGGGGYSGGDGGRLAGGAGSYNGGSSQSNTAGARSGQGLVTIDKL